MIFEEKGDKEDTICVCYWCICTSSPSSSSSHHHHHHHYCFAHHIKDVIMNHHHRDIHHMPWSRNSNLGFPSLSYTAQPPSWVSTPCLNASSLGLRSSQLPSETPTMFEVSRWPTLTVACPRCPQAVETRTCFLRLYHHSVLQGRLVGNLPFLVPVARAS